MNSIPFPGKLFFDMGDSFLTGTALGSCWFFLKGAYYSIPKRRIRGGIILLREKAPLIGANFATWSFFYSLSHYTTSLIRKKDDPINSLISNFSAGFITSIRSGFKNAFKRGLTGGLTLAAIDGMMILMSNYQKKIQIIKENQILNLYKKEYEKKGFKFIPNQSLNKENQKSYI